MLEEELEELFLLVPLSHDSRSCDPSCDPLSGLEGARSLLVKKCVRLEGIPTCLLPVLPITAPVLEAVLVEVVDTLGEQEISLGGLKGDTFFL